MSLSTRGTADGSRRSTRMSHDMKFGRYCDGCGCTIQKAHKIHLAREYCGTCYKRFFQRMPCGSCEGYAVVHKNHKSTVVCFACEVSTRVCLRCEKPVPRAGLLVSGKAICPSCAPYFRRPQSCSQCGKESSRIATAPSIGITVKVCDSCRNKVTHESCVVCRKYRKVARTTDRGALCGRCAENENFSHPCPTCGDPVPGGGSSRCRICLNRNSIAQEVRLSSALFRNKWAAALWAEFTQWIQQRNLGSPRVLTVVRSHQIFFERLDSYYSVVEEITADSLLRLFGTIELRRHLLATEFVTTRLSLIITAEAKRDYADFDRITALLSSAKRTPHEQVVVSYSKYLDRLYLSPRTTRMYLSTASAFCVAEQIGTNPWTPGQLERYVKQNIGARNNLSRFVTFCRNTLHWDVAMPAKGMKVRPLADPVQSVKKLTRLLQKIRENGLQNASKQMVASILSTSLGVTTLSILSLQIADLHISEDSITLLVASEMIDLPADLWPYAKRYAQLLAVQNHNIVP